MVIQIEIGRGRKRSGVVKIDESSLALVQAHKWYVDVYGYAMTTVRDARCRRGKRNIGMHRMITAAPTGVEVDHRNGDLLDNRLENLRLCSHEENMRNRKTRHNNKCGLKGVTLLKRSGRWMAQIGFAGNNKYLGTFDRPEDAHLAYQRAAVALHGEFARLA